MLDALFIDYLANGFAEPWRARLAVALEASGYMLEAAALRGSETPSPIVEVPDSPWSGRRVWTGTQLPRDADAGDLWLDTCELTPMLLLARPIGWLATRPILRWQFAAFLTLARFTRREVQLEPPLQLLDPRRLMQGAEVAPMVNLTADEARLCASWFGKAVCNLAAWRAAKRFLAPHAMRAFWGVSAREWAGYLDEESRLVVTPRTIDTDPREEDDLGEPPAGTERMVFGEWAKPPGVTFRTYAPTQLGLFTELGEDGAWHLNVRLASRAPR